MEKKQLCTTFPLWNTAYPVRAKRSTLDRRPNEKPLEYVRMILRKHISSLQAGLRNNLETKRQQTTFPTHLERCVKSNSQFG